MLDLILPLIPFYFGPNLNQITTKLNGCEFFQYEKAKFIFMGEGDGNRRVKSGTSGHFYCNNTYSLDGAETFQCYNGTWKLDGNPPVCRLFNNINSTRTTCDFEWKKPEDADESMLYKINTFNEDGYWFKAKYVRTSDDTITTTIPELEPGRNYIARLEYKTGGSNEHQMLKNCTTKN